MKSGRPFGPEFSVAVPTSTGGAEAKSSYALCSLIRMSDKSVIHEEVAWQITHQCELGSDNQVRTPALRISNPAHDQRGISLGVTHCRVDLKQSNKHRSVDLVIRVLLETRVRDG